MNRVRFLKKIALAACFSLALAFTFSCSSDGNASSESTYWFSSYGVTDPEACAEIDEEVSNPNQNEPDYNPTFDELKEFWLEMRGSGYGETIVSREISETKLRNAWLENGRTPSETNELLNELNQRGNFINLTWGYSKYCYTFEYFEKM